MTSADQSLSSPEAARPTPADGLALGMAMLLGLSIVQRGIGLVRNIWMCRLMDPQALGEWNLAMNFFVIAAPLLVLGIPGTFGRYVERYRLRGELSPFLQSTLRLVAVAAAVGLVVLLCFQRSLGYVIFGRQTSAIIMISCITVLAVTVVYNLLVELLTALRQPRIVSLMHLTNSMLFTLGALVLLVVTGGRTMAVIASLGVASSVALLVGMVLLMAKRREWRNPRSAHTDLHATNAGWQPRHLWGILAPFAAWLWVNDLLSNLFLAVDRYMIVHFSNLSPGGALASVGQYHSSFVLGALIITFGEMASSILLPYWTHDWEQRRHNRVMSNIHVSLQLTAVVLTAGGCILLVGSGWLFDHVMQGRYAVGRQILPLSLASCCWLALMAMSRNFLWLCEKPRWVSATQLIGLLANVVLNACLLPRWGLLGAVLATMSASFIVLVLMMVVCHRNGLQWRCSTLLCLLLPGTLLGGPALVVVTLAGGAVWAIFRGVGLSAEARTRLISHVDSFLGRVGFAPRQ